MTLEELYAEWAKDGEIDQHNVSNESANIPKLHNKYFRMYSEEGLRRVKLKADYKSLVKLKTEYYKGELTSGDLAEHGWEPWLTRVLKQDLPTYIESDEDIKKKSLRIAYQQSIVDFLQDIIKLVHNRGFQLKTIVDWERFRSGA